MTKKKRIQIIKIVIQIIFFIVAPSAFSVAFGGVKAAFVAIGFGEKVNYTPMIILLLSILAFTMFFGRFFCGNACAFGTLGDFVYKISKIFQNKSGYKLPLLPKKADKVFVFLKYIVLIVIIVMCIVGINDLIPKSSPWSVFSFALSRNNVFKAGYTIAWLVFGLIILAMASVERFFCRFLCPLGAIFALIPQIPFITLNKERAQCKSCNVCTNACIVKLELNKQDVVSSGECLDCKKCIGGCPKKHMSHAIFGKKLAEIPLMLVQSFILMGLLVANKITIFQ